MNIQKTKTYQTISVAFVLLIIISFLVLVFLRPNLSKSTSFKFDFTEPKRSETELDLIIKSNLDGVDGKYAVFVEDLQTQQVYTLNDQDTFPAASLYKLFLISAAMQSIQNQSLNKDTVIKSTKSHLEKSYGDIDYGYEDINEEDISFSVDEILQRIGRISDNFASIMLAEKIGWDSVQAESDTIGNKKTSIKNPITTTASDIGNFFVKLHNNQIISAEASEDIKRYLELNQINDRIPAKIPEGTKIIHKTGELAHVRHDAGIVFAKRPFVIVVLSQDVPFEDSANEVIADLSYNIFKYFNESGR